MGADHAPFRGIRGAISRLRRLRRLGRQLGLVLRRGRLSTRFENVKLSAIRKSIEIIIERRGHRIFEHLILNKAQHAGLEYSI